MTPCSVARLFTMVALVLMAAGCASDAPSPTRTTDTSATASTPATTTPTPTASPTPTITPQPTPTPLVTISQETDLGVVTLEIPAPLLGPGVDVTIETRGEEEAPRDIRDAGARQPFHVLLPQDLTFTQPIGVTVEMPLGKFTRPTGSIAIAFLTIRSPGGTWSWLDDPSVAITADTVTLRGTTTRFGALFAWSDRTDLVRVPVALGEHAVGEVFRPQVTIESREPREHPVAFVGDPEFVNHDPDVIDLGPPLGPVTLRDWRCDALGDFAVTLTGRLTNFGFDNPFFSVTLDVPPTEGDFAYGMTGSCVAEPAPTPTSSPNISPTSSP